MSLYYGNVRDKQAGLIKATPWRAIPKPFTECAMRRLALLLYLCPLLATGVPRFDPTALLREVLVPADVAVGSVIYRLRASDTAFDYPLVFSLRGGQRIVDVEGLNCTRFNSVCQANVILRKRLEPGRYYDFTVDIRNQRGDTASLNCSFRATNATTPIERIFPGAPTLLTVSEKARRNTELGTILAKGNPNRMKPVLLELWGSPQFALHQKLVTDRDAEGTILLLSPLDYEIKTVHHLTVLANDPWTNMEEDTRNIAGWPLLVAVIDEQDTPPVFTIAPPTTTLSPTLNPGDLILRVHADDGDKGNPRDIRYGLVPNGELSSRFFNINEDSGELTLARPLSEIFSYSNTGQPILITVVADEVRSNPREAPAQSTTVQLALIPPGVTAGLPTFGSIEYHALLDENSPTGTILELPQAEISTQPGDVVTLELLNNNGTFDISPSVVEGFSKFTISVHDNSLLDYEERNSVECYIVAKEFTKGNFSARAKLTVILNDVNDNPPQFVQTQFQASIQENAAIGTTVLVVEATDVDNGIGGKIKYSNLSGEGSGLFRLDPKTGVITVASELDADTLPVINLIVEAIDQNGKGLKSTAIVQINLVDINDNSPKFEKESYEFILNLDGISFTSPAFIKATDADVSSPNNEVHYELINSPDNIYLNEITGELLVKKMWESSDVTILQARAWDGGIPRLSSECEIRIYPPEGQSKKLVFILPGRNPDREDVAKTLSALTGGRVLINSIKPYTGLEPEVTYVAKDDKERSVVEATVTYSKGSVIDLNKIQQILDSENAVIQQKEQTITQTQKETIIKESGGGNLLWLLILLIVLAILAAIILILCCICRPCPLYIPPKRRKIKSAEAVEKLIVKGSGQGQESKSVQVAEWFGRKEAWSADREPAAIMIDHEIDSLRRHEMDRGSDRGGMMRPIHRLERAPPPPPPPMPQDPTRDHYYIREGNTDILRLITRGGEPQRPITLIEQQYLADSGKDILMKRFIDQQQMQQADAARSQVLLPNAVSRLQSEHDLLEASLRQQNAILRQLLLERERDLRLETQSLPAGTQTDQDAGTQTEPQYLRPPRRKVRSDNDASDQSDEELAVIKARAKRRSRNHVKRNIKTPIQEETELEVIERPQKNKAEKVESSKPRIKQTRTSELRQQRASSEARSTRSKSSRSGIHKDVLREISASLEHSDESDNYFNKEETPRNRELYSEDSLEEISPRSDKTTDSGKHRYHSESDLRIMSSQKTSSESPREKSQSHSDLSQVKGTKTSKKPVKKTARYMEWYTKNKPESKNDKEKSKKKEDLSARASSRLSKQTESSSRKIVEKKKPVVGPEHPLLQHSEHRYEGKYPKRRPEEDTDSGIVLTKPEMAQKRSVFTIAYNDIHTSQLRADSSTTP